MLFCIGLPQLSILLKHGKNVQSTLGAAADTVVLGTVVLRQILRYQRGDRAPHTQATLSALASKLDATSLNPYANMISAS